MSLSKSQLLQKVKREIVEVAADQVHRELQAGKPLRLVDVREREEVMDGYIAGAALIPRGFLELNIEDEVSADRDTPIVLYCAGGNRSADVRPADGGVLDRSRRVGPPHLANGAVCRARHRERSRGDDVPRRSRRR